MKPFACVLPLLFTTLVIGCTGNNELFNAPVYEDSSTIPVAKPGCRQIVVDALLHEPGAFNSFVEISGSIEYVTSIVPRDPIPPNPQFSIAVGLLLNVELRPHEIRNPVWHVAVSSEDEVVPTDKDGRIGYLTKRYWVDGMKKWLCLSFMITETTVELDTIWLALPKSPAVRDEK